MDQHLLDQINACFRDVHAFNSIVFTGLIGRLDRDGILSKNAAAAWLKATAAQCEEWRSDQQGATCFAIWRTRSSIQKQRHAGRRG